jgi:hypothetical protein
MSTWADVALGDMVIGKDGHEWLVGKIANVEKGTRRRVTVTRDNKEHDITVPADAEVVIAAQAAPVIKGVDPLDLATAVVTSTIGGEIIKHVDPADIVPRVPRTFAHLGSALAHLYLEHGVRDVTTRKAYDERHAALHASVPHEGYRDHTHDLG